jgi:hypothetical protein
MMYPTSETFKRRIRQGGRRKTVVDVYYNGQLVKADLPVESGSIRVDRNAGVRRSGSITVPDKSLIPVFLNDVLSPYGTEIKIRQGIVYPNGEEELVPLGVFVLDTTSWDESEGPIPSIEFYDRSIILERAQIGNVWDFSGFTAQKAILKIIVNLFPEYFDELSFEDGLNNYRIPGGTAYDSGNTWTIAQEIARGMGGEIYFDLDGLPVVKKLPHFDRSTLDAEAVWTFDVGEDGVLQTADRSITREGTYNRIFVKGRANENGHFPRADVRNNDADSPLRVNGPFRGQGFTIQDDKLTTTAQCSRVGLQKLAELCRLSRTLSFTAIPNPAIQEGDIVLLKYLDGSTELGLIESMTIPLGPGEFNATASTFKEFLIA